MAFTDPNDLVEHLRNLESNLGTSEKKRVAVMEALHYVSPYTNASELDLSLIA